MPGFDYVSGWHAKRLEMGWWHSFRMPDGSIIEGVNRLPTLENRLAQFPIPADLHGKRALDIGCWDGWFSFELERRGAEVMAIDNWDNPRFRHIHSAYQSRVDYRQLDMYELIPERIGRFDIVLFMGVLYHLKHPLLALERVCALSTDFAAVDSLVLRQGQYPDDVLRRPILEFFETDELGGQVDNWFCPSLPALLGMCRVAGFARVELRSVLDFSACVACYRKWEDEILPGEAPVLQSALHAENFGVNFRSDKDDYAAIWFQSPLPLTLANVQPEVSGFGMRPMSVTELHPHQWQVNFKLPPLAGPGWHDVRVRLAGGPRSNALPIAVDLPFVVESVRLESVFDGTTWRSCELDTSKGSVISFWVEGLPENADLNNVKATLAGERLRMLYIEPVKATKGTTRQVNAAITSEIPAGPVPLIVTVGEKVAGQVTVEVKS